LSFKNDVAIIGGAGHVGLPLAIMLASRGLKTLIYDISAASVEKVAASQMPFLEPGAQEILEEVIANGNLEASTDPNVVLNCENVIIVIGTPVDEHLNPDPMALPKAIEELAPYLRNDQLIVLRSTIFPGVTQAVDATLKRLGLSSDLAFCPERIAEHNAIEELVSLPQIISGVSESAAKRAEKLFRNLTSEIVRVTPEEAELAKLFTNTWRYIKFAVANQFFMMANDRGLDFEKIRHAVKHNYPRAMDLTIAGLAAGTCLFKDTMQLAAFSDNKFALGHSAMLVNEGLPLYVVTKLEERYGDLNYMTVGILGMSFKAESDDIRSSLSYKLKKILEFRAQKVLCSDPYVSLETDSKLIPEEKLIQESDLVIIATPHGRYKTLAHSKPVVDIWGLLGKGSLV
jgi:UDP-N-acetyl-D-mannosaminuronic acid dehydrogenase